MLQYLGQVDLVISVLYVLFLSSIGSMMFTESLSTLLKQRKMRLNPDDQPQTISADKQTRFQKFRDNLPYKMNFPDSRVSISAFVPLGIGIVGGLMVSVMGIGAGFLLVPAMIYLLRMPPLLVAGTSLAQIMIIVL